MKTTLTPVLSTEILVSQVSTAQINLHQNRLQASFVDFVHLGILETVSNVLVSSRMIMLRAMNLGMRPASTPPKRCHAILFITSVYRTFNVGYKSQK